MNEYNETELLKAYDALQDVKMFIKMNEVQREGINIAQRIIMDMISAKRKTQDK